VTASAGRFTEALLGARLPLIMEVKRRDGNDVELMRERTVGDIVAQYVAAGAPCISVVTGRWFGGDDQMLRDVAELTDLPILKKDFITRESQIVNAKQMGASAILLTARILPKSSFQSLIETILGHGLTPFVEVADVDELESVVHAEDCIVAINNKDIRNQERDGGEIDVSRSLLPATLATGTPCPVSASAITEPRVAAELIAAGFRGLLIGTGLLLSDSVQGWVDEFERHRNALSDERTVPPSGSQPQTNSGVEPGSRSSIH
jgi:indole-3-glycerol phosphate synthase